MTDLVRPDPASLAQSAAEWIATTLAGRPGRLAVALSGGSTPRLLYAALARAPLLDVVPWERVHWFWGDERFVAEDDPRSNQAMVRAAMLDHAPVPEGNVHPVPTTGLSPAAAAAAYEAELRAFYAERGEVGGPLFELVLLGLGTNGHTASLFPGERVLEERTAWAAPVSPPGEPTRITLTWPSLESCRDAAFLVAGAEKRGVVARVRDGDMGLVASHYRPAGALHWWLDAAAAG